MQLTAQEGDRTDDPVPTEPSAVEREAPPNASEAVPTARAFRRDGEIEIDGRIAEDAWESARPVSGFVQAQPVEGAAAEHDTEVRFLYDEEAVYVGARMHDPRPGTIADQLVRRDQPGQYDYVSVAFDSNDDRRTAYQFQVSAAGVQSDTYFFDDSRSDDAWDAVWESAVQQDGEGWTAELRIPLSQLRYEASDTVQSWGVNVRRRRLASNEETHLSLVSRLQQGVVSQFGRLEGLRIDRASRRLEVVPYAVTRAHTGPAEPGDPFFDGAEADIRVGGDVKYGIGGNFTLDATINPDFGQVEADPAVINLSAFETFFEERRPFFVEDAQVFDFDLGGRQNSLFYSRRIGRSPHGDEPPGADFSDVPDNTTILGAAKLSGRTAGGLSVGALGAVTAEETGDAYFADEDERREFMAEPQAQYGVFRLQQDLGDGASQIGGLVTGVRRDLPSGGAFDHLTSEAFSGGLDFEVQWSDREWALTGFLAGSHVRGDSTALIRIQRSSTHYFQRPDARYVEMDSTATSMSGAAWQLQFQRRRGDWTGGLWVGEVTPGFEINDLGFSQTQEQFDVGARLGYREIDPGEILRSWNVNAFTVHNWSHDVLETGLGSFRNWRDAHQGGTVQMRGQIELLNYWRFDGELGYGPRSLSRTATRGGPLMVEPANVEASVGFRTDRRQPFNFGADVRYRADRIGNGNSFEVGAEFEIRPSSQLEIRVEPEFSTSVDPAQYVGTTDGPPFEPTYGRRYLFGELERREWSMETRVDWAFSPTLTLQVFAQPLLSSGDYVGYRQLAEAETFRFDDFEEGEAVEVGGSVACVEGRTCEDASHTRYVDFDRDGTVDHSFRDRDFNVRSLIGNAVLRWEFRPGSRLYLVWQRQQSDRAATGDFRFGRDGSALFSAPSDDVFILKMDYWIGF